MDGIVYDFVEIPEDKEHTKITYQPRGNTNKIHRQGDSTILKIGCLCRGKLVFIQYLNQNALWVEAIQLKR